MQALHRARIRVLKRCRRGPYSVHSSITSMGYPLLQHEIPMDSGIGLSITIDKLRVFVNKTLST